jgi:hypothetical protein
MQKAQNPARKSKFRTLGAPGLLLDRSASDRLNKTKTAQVRRVDLSDAVVAELQA